ncbi:MAG: hypothetical protein EKK47_10400 [Burkholderiales bacterium]|nr:MAG: hypothetical protein EKK47_10400 [Burkholderiales bacterium]
MSSKAFLHDRKEIVQVILGTTYQHKAELAAYMDRMLATSLQRQEVALALTLRRSNEKRQAIRQAAAKVDMGSTNALREVMDHLASQPDQFGLRQSPCDEVVRAEVRMLQVNTISVLKSLPLQLSSTYPSTSTTSSSAQARHGLF